MNSNVFCIDASCFLNLQKQRDLLRIIKELQNKNPNPVEIYLPTHIYNAIMLTPDRKFLQLNEILKDWKESNFDLKFSEEEKDEYVNNTRKFLFEYNPKPVPEKISNSEKLGSESIFKKDVVSKFGKIVGDIIWDTISASEKLGGSIISFGEKTISMLSDFGSKVRKGYSKS